MKRIRALNVVGTRPNFVKIAPLMAAMRASGAFDARLIHTGQHYDRRMAQVFFEELGIPAPDSNLGVGSGTHAWQTGQVMIRMEKLMAGDPPDLVVVVGDVNSTLAAALAAAKLHIPVAHVEAGLRSFDRDMPEEINRVLTDHLADYLFVSEPSGLENLRHEGIPDERVFLVGNIMIDTLMRCRERAENCGVRKRLGLDGRSYAVLTLHRPSSVDDADALERILGAVEKVQRRLPVVFPVHPRARRRLDERGLGPRVARAGNLQLVEPLGYLEFLGLMSGAQLVMSDSGGIQEETVVLGVPCITLRENTERPVTLQSGYHVLAGSDAAKIIAAAEAFLAAPPSAPHVVDLWDGHTAERIVRVLAECRAPLKGN